MLWIICKFKYLWSVQKCAFYLTFKVSPVFTKTILRLLSKCCFNENKSWLVSIFMICLLSQSSISPKLYFSLELLFNYCFIQIHKKWLLTSSGKSWWSEVGLCYIVNLKNYDVPLTRSISLQLNGAVALYTNIHVLLAAW